MTFCKGTCTYTYIHIYTYVYVNIYIHVYLKQNHKIIRHNGIDICQSEDGIKIFAETYFTKIISTKVFIMTVPQNRPLPMTSDKEQMTKLELTVGPNDTSSQRELQTTAGFKYRNATGELIFAMVTY